MLFFLLYSIFFPPTPGGLLRRTYQSSVPENGIHMKVLSKGKPNEKCVPDNDITLEDAYIYLTNS